MKKTTTRETVWLQVKVNFPTVTVIESQNKDGTSQGPSAWLIQNTVHQIAV